MTLVVCVDDALGMMFNRRRQSRDRALRERILSRKGNSQLWMSAYSAELFQETDGTRICETLPTEADGEAFVFVENGPMPEAPDEIYLYRWNRRYPADRYFQVDLTKYELISREDFAGFSHEKITEEHYKRRTDD